MILQGFHLHTQVFNEGLNFRLSLSKFTNGAVLLQPLQEEILGHALGYREGVILTHLLSGSWSTSETALIRTSCSLLGSQGEAEANGSPPPVLSPSLHCSAPTESVHAHAPPWPTPTVFKKTYTNTHTFLLVFKEKALVSNIGLVSLNLKTSPQPRSFVSLPLITTVLTNDLSEQSSKLLPLK